MSEISIAIADDNLQTLNLLNDITGRRGGFSCSRKSG